MRCSNRKPPPGRGIVRAVAFAALCVIHAAAATSTTEPGRAARTVTFPPGARDTALHGQVTGRLHADYRVRAGAGQSLRVRLTSPHAGLQFNVIAPGGAGNVAMFAGGGASEPFDRLLPIAGASTIRVYLVRAAARRDEMASFALDVMLDGEARRPLPTREDARLPGTPFHARTEAPCETVYSAARRCTLSVIRYDRMGSGSVVLRWPQGRRTVPFDKGRPSASDAAQPMAAQREGEITILRFGDDRERFEVPDLLLTGG